jgi:alpha-D-ribose 1-methylphosphonate 5-triphosphate diphosphatase
MHQSSRVIVTNTDLILPDRTMHGSVVIEDGRIADILPRRFPEGHDLDGAFLIPGIIDIHSDYIEREIHPRPSAEFPLPLAFHFMDVRAICSGITTLLSAARFSPAQEDSDKAPFGRELAAAFGRLRETALARHYIHARWNPVFEPADELLAQLLKLPYVGNLVYNDWTPGERQFRDMDTLIRNYAVRKQVSAEAAAEYFEKRLAAAKSMNNRPIVKEALYGKVPLGSHDDTTVEHVLEAYEYGSTLAEMPVTMEAARKAKELGMLVCMGAPNYYRGGSHCGNLSCADALAEGLVDILCSDYHFPSLLTSASLMMERGMSPSQAVSLITLNPARHLGLANELGSIEIGKKADLAAFKPRDQHAFVSHVWVEGEMRYAAGHGLRIESSKTTAEVFA